MDPFGIAIFCDDIREEVGGKVSLAGCYAYDMRFTDISFPIGIPKLGIYVVGRLPSDQPIPPLQLLVYFPGDADEPSVKIDIPQTSLPESPSSLDPDLQRAGGLRYPLLIAPALFREPGFVRVRLMYGQQRLRLGALKIHSVISELQPG
jgi:hypothetical protein